MLREILQKGHFCYFRAANPPFLTEWRTIVLSHERLQPPFKNFQIRLWFVLFLHIPYAVNIFFYIISIHFMMWNWNAKYILNRKIKIMLVNFGPVVFIKQNSKLSQIQFMFIVSWLSFSFLFSSAKQGPWWAIAGFRGRVAGVASTTLVGNFCKKSHLGYILRLQTPFLDQMADKSTSHDWGGKSPPPPNFKL